MSESQKPTSATQIVLKFNRIKVYIVAIFPEIFRPIVPVEGSFRWLTIQERLRFLTQKKSQIATPSTYKHSKTDFYYSDRSSENFTE